MNTPSTDPRERGIPTDPDAQRAPPRPAHPRTAPPPGDEGPTPGRNDTDRDSSSLRSEHSA